MCLRARPAGGGGWGPEDTMASQDHIAMVGKYRPPRPAAESAVLTGAYAITHLGTRAQTAPGERLADQNPLGETD